jgi:thiol-disulfide isomerase/thioredoxin
MTKTIFISILLGIVFFSNIAKAQDSTQVDVKQDTININYNQVILDTNIEKAILIGYCTEDGLRTSPIFSNYFEKEYMHYQPKLDFLETLTESFNQIRIVVVFGSWCSDSQREVPRLMRILDEMNYPLDSLTIIGVNRLKTVPDIDISRLMIEYVPTIIFYKGDFEIGRIVEAPLETLEDDIASILMKAF